MLTEDPVPRPGPTLRVTRIGSAGGSVALVVAGELDTLTVPELRAAIDVVLADPTCRRLVLDLAAVTFLSSAGLSVLVTARETGQARKIELLLAGLGANRAVRRPLELTGLLDLFSLQPDDPGGS